MHFRNKNALVIKRVFMCGNKAIDLCCQYKYLGLMLQEHLNFQVTAKDVSKSQGTGSTLCHN